MRLTSPALLSVFLVTSVSAVPAPDKFTHFSDPGCPALGAKACLLVDYCQYHRDRGDLFTTRNGELKSRDTHETENSKFNPKDAFSLSTFIPRELDIKWKRVRHSRSVQCGTLACYNNHEVSEPFRTLIAGAIYNMIVDYPFPGATGGTIGLFAKVFFAGAYHMVRIGQARTLYGGPRFTFMARPEAIFYQVMFIGDQPGTAAINFFITRRSD